MKDHRWLSPVAQFSLLYSSLPPFIHIHQNNIKSSEQVSEWPITQIHLCANQASSTLHSLLFTYDGINIIIDNNYNNNNNNYYYYYIPKQKNIYIYMHVCVLQM